MENGRRHVLYVVGASPLMADAGAPGEEDAVGPVAPLSRVSRRLSEVSSKGGETVCDESGVVV